MKHLDEGTLQAWLDMPRSGLDPSEVAEIERHLASCRACASELEALRGSDERVHTLLAGGLDRDIERPPFAEVVARAERDRGARRGLSRLNTLAWAASIVVALGVGWMTNELYRGGPPVPTPGLPVAPAAEAADRDDARAPEAEVAGTSAVEAEAIGGARAPGSSVDVEARAPEDPGTGSGAAPEPPARASSVAQAGARDRLAPEETRERQDGRLEEVERLAEPAAPAPPVAADTRAADVANAVAPAPNAADRVDSAPDAAAAYELRAYSDSAAASRALVRGVVRDATGEPIPSAQVFVAELDVGTLSQEDGSYVIQLPSAPGDASELDLTVQRIGYGTQSREIAIGGGGVTVADFDLQEEALMLDEVVVTGTAGRTQRRAIGNTVERLTAVPVLDWRPDSREAVEAELGEDVLTVPGLAVLSVESALGTGPDGVLLARVRQGLGEDGAALTLVEGLGEGAQEEWPIPSEGARASRRIGELLVTGTAPVSADSLRVLLDALR